ncbi:MAG: Gfo/Idh/MocA family oxidoreductase [Ruminiclostridium sp.]|nr:Gfo/Idh/MocA family oxidoreductase [Ruminiclostridium sp.]
MSKTKIGIIGTGGISDYHMRGYIADDRCEVCAICDINEGRAKEYARKYGIEHVYTDYTEMLKREDIDAVSICTWNSLHASLSISALNAGKHVLCEKPMAINTKEALEMEKAAGKSGKLLMVGFVRRFGNDARILKDFIDNGYMGEIYYAKASYLRRNGCPGRWFGDKKRSGGGPLIDLGVHVIDLVWFLMGRPKVASVTGVAFNKLGARNNIKGTKGYAEAGLGNLFDVEDMAAAMIKFDNGAALFVETSFSLNIKKDCGNIELFGTKSGARLDPDLEFYSEQNGYMVDVTPALDTRLNSEGLFESETAHFIDCIREGARCISPAEDGVEVMRILDAVYESASTGREVVV